MVIGQARVLLAPLRFGAGLKGKLIDAMMNGTPSITTHIGAEAMHNNLPWSGVIVDKPGSFADAAIKLYKNQQQWLDFQQNGDLILQKNYSRALFEEKFITRILQHYHSLEALRQQNFYGLMLRHHSMKSTQYMAQWIEEKNR